MKLKVINVSGVEYIGEVKGDQLEKGSPMVLQTPMQIERRVVPTERGPARAMFMHPMTDYSFRSWNGVREPTLYEANAYMEERMAAANIKPARQMPKEPPPGQPERPSGILTP